MTLPGHGREDLVWLRAERNSHANLVGPDDWEAYHRVQSGLTEEGGNDWISLHRYVGQEDVAADGTKTAAGTSDMVFRHQFQAWKSYMVDGGTFS